MKPFQQYIALLRFQALSFFMLCMFPITIGWIPCSTLMATRNWGNLNTPILCAVYLLLIPMLMAMNLFSPELQAGIPGTLLRTQQNTHGFSPDFLLTRAIDRANIFRARATLYWIAILLLPAFLIGLAAWKPSINIDVPLQPPGSAKVYLEALPGASVTMTTKTQETITSPTGRLAIAGAMGLIGILLAAICQGFVFAIKGIKFKRLIFYTVLIGGMFFSTGLLLWGDHRLPENILLLVLNHPIAGTGLTALFVAAANMFSAAKAKMIEFP